MTIEAVTEQVNTYNALLQEREKLQLIIDASDSVALELRLASSSVVVVLATHERNLVKDIISSRITEIETQMTTITNTFTGI